MRSEAVQREPVECSIRVDGVEITAHYRALQEVSVDTRRGAATVASLVFEPVRDERGQWSVQDAGVFQPWRRIRIEACFGSRREEVMRGYIRDITLEHPADMSGVRVTVQAQDESIALDREHLRRNWSREDRSITDGQIARQIAAAHGLQARVETGLTHTSLNCDQTAIQFLQGRAEANGFELHVRDGVLHFGAAQLGGTPQPTIMVYAGRATNCLRFDIRHDGHLPDRVRLTRAAERGEQADEETAAPDLPLLGRVAADSAGVGLPPFVWTLPRPLGATLAEARARARGRANEAAWKVIAEGELDGGLYQHVLLTHRTVAVDGVGDTYGGLYYVDQVGHTFNAGGYRQTFRLLRNALGANLAPGSDRLAPIR